MNQELQSTEQAAGPKREPGQLATMMANQEAKRREHIEKSTSEAWALFWEIITRDVFGEATDQDASELSALLDDMEDLGILRREGEEAELDGPLNRKEIVDRSMRLAKSLKDNTVEAMKQRFYREHLHRAKAEAKLLDDWYKHQVKQLRKRYLSYMPPRRDNAILTHVRPQSPQFSPIVTEDDQLDIKIMKLPSHLQEQLQRQAESEMTQLVEKTEQLALPPGVMAALQQFESDREEKRKADREFSQASTDRALEDAKQNAERRAAEANSRHLQNPMSE